MKKLLFASALCATVAAFAADTSGNTFNPANYTGFDGFMQDASTPKQIGGNNDTGDASEPIFFAYVADNGSTDASQVKEYSVEFPAFGIPTCGVPDFFQEDATNTKYLDLSTEGGTLWRTVNPISGEGLPAGVAIFDDSAWEKKSDVYIDTMVQFTPTEDGDTPTLDAADKMAIWLNVEEVVDGGETNTVTNLCVRAGIFEGSSVTPTNFVVDATVNAGVWYRLTVQAIGDVTGGDGIPGFKIFLDGVSLQAKGGLEGITGDATVFCALTGDSDYTLSAVGFKGSGKLDDLAITDDMPDFLIGGGSSIDFTLTWDANVSAVSYTIAGTTTSIADLTSGTTTVSVPAGTTVTVAATPAAWYQVTAGTGDTTVAADTTVAITTALADTPADAGATGLPSTISTSQAKAWADANSLTPADIAGCTFAEKAYLLNTGVTVEPTFEITAIEEVTGGWKITVEAKSGSDTIDLEDINGTLKVKTGATLEALASATSTEILAANLIYDADGKAEITITDSNAKFMKATVE